MKKIEDNTQGKLHWLDIVTASRVAKAVKLHIHYFMAPFKLPIWKLVLEYCGRISYTMPSITCQTSSVDFQHLMMEIS